MHHARASRRVVRCTAAARALSSTTLRRSERAQCGGSARIPCAGGKTRGGGVASTACARSFHRRVLRAARGLRGGAVVRRTEMRAPQEGKLLARVVAVVRVPDASHVKSVAYSVPMSTIPIHRPSHLFGVGGGCGARGAEAALWSGCGTSKEAEVRGALNTASSILVRITAACQRHEWTRRAVRERSRQHARSFTRRIPLRCLRARPACGPVFAAKLLMLFDRLAPINLGRGQGAEGRA